MPNTSAESNCSKLKNGKKLSRYYGNIYTDSFDAYADFYNSSYVRKNECIDEKHPLMAGQYMSVYDAHVNNEGNLIDDATYMVPDENIKGLVKAANSDIMNWTAENRGLFDYVVEYDPAKDTSAYSLDVCVDYRLPGAKASELEQYNKYFMFTDDDRNIAKYFEEHPEVMSEKNIIESDDPILGNWDE